MNVHKTNLEEYFSKFRENIIGQHQAFSVFGGEKEIIYTDWAATARGYKPIEDFIQREVIPFIGNTHTLSTITGSLMSQAYDEAKKIMKTHVGASDEDAIIFCGSGMTACVNKLQRLLGLRLPERITDYIHHMNYGTDLKYSLPRDAASILNKHLYMDETLKPVLFVTHMEHHSNHVSWLETICTVEIIGCNNEGNVDLVHFQSLLDKYSYRKNKIAAVTACSNVTGIETPYHTIAKMIHQHEGLCFVDFSCSAPYVNINMHPKESGTHLDAIYFSGHKFLGGPGTPGVLIFHKNLYQNSIPDHPGGGTVIYTNPWKEHQYIVDLEQREDGGTPPFMQSIKLAMCVKLKEQMGTENILQREEELIKLAIPRLSSILNLELLESKIKKQLGIFSFRIIGAHYNLIVRMLNDKYGIQARGGCSCAGTYGHTLLKVSKPQSYEIYQKISNGDLSSKPGWIRISIHPTMTNTEMEYILDAIEMTAGNFHSWQTDYYYDHSNNEFEPHGNLFSKSDFVKEWFKPLAWNQADHSFLNIEKSFAG